MADRRETANDLELSVATAIEGRLRSLWTALPCVVASYDPASMTVECRPALQGLVLARDGTQSWATMPLLVDVPVAFPSAGGFMLTLPIQPGDEVLVVFSSRCIDAWWASGGVQQQAELRLHDLSDGFAIPGVRAKPHVPAVPPSTTHAELRNDARTCAVSLGQDGVITLHADRIEADCTIRATDFITGALTSYNGHIHGGVQNGGGQTTSPVPGS